jgi:hypothetical protein
MYHNMSTLEAWGQCSKTTKSAIFWDVTPCTATCCLLVFAELIPSTLKMEAICSSATSVKTRRTTRRHIPEDDTLHNHHCVNLNSYTKWQCLLPGTIRPLDLTVILWYISIMKDNHSLCSHKCINYQPVFISIIIISVYNIIRSAKNDKYMSQYVYRGITAKQNHMSTI